MMKCFGKSLVLFPLRYSEELKSLVVQYINASSFFFSFFNL